MIDPGMKWEEYPGDTLYLWNGRVLYTAMQDFGYNVSEADEYQGYKDSWVVDIYSLTEDVPQGGQWMERERISDMNYTIQGIMDRLGQCDLWEDIWRILEPDLGSGLMLAIMKANAYESLLMKRSRSNG